MGDGETPWGLGPNGGGSFASFWASGGSFAPKWGGGSSFAFRYVASQSEGGTLLANQGRLVTQIRSNFLFFIPLEIDIEGIEMASKRSKMRF